MLLGFTYSICPFPAGRPLLQPRLSGNQAGNPVNASQSRNWSQAIHGPIQEGY
jgi:hypothetical protein